MVDFVGLYLVFKLPQILQLAPQLTQPVPSLLQLAAKCTQLNYTQDFNRLLSQDQRAPARSSAAPHTTDLDLFHRSL